ncbi:hypothetical protein MCHI_002002 [Candidatus Magnetoovum chiemensis]|nr:hypothetical protein MCHI_002002 [Candidatus Magnetoovum chiemensis]
MGIPIVATNWNGFREIVAAAGTLVKFRQSDDREIDINAEDIACAIASVLNSPPSSQECAAQASRFSADKVRALYRKTLGEALNEARQLNSTSAQSGLLKITAPLGAFKWHELFDMHIEDCAAVRLMWIGQALDDQPQMQILRSIIAASVQKPLERFMAQMDYSKYTEALGDTNKLIVRGDSFYEKVFFGTTVKSSLTSKQVCVNALRELGQSELFIACMSVLHKYCDSSSLGYSYLRADIELELCNYDRAYEISLGSGKFSEHAHQRLRQLAKVSRTIGKPYSALPYLRQWLELFPDSINAGPLWIDRCLNAFKCGKGCEDEAMASYGMAYRLLGDTPVLGKIKGNFFKKISLYKKPFKNYPL